MVSVNLPPELEARLRAKVDSGEYGSIDAVITEAAQNFLDGVDLALSSDESPFKRQIQQGLADLEAGRHRDGPTVINEILAESRRRQGLST